MKYGSLLAANICTARKPAPVTKHAEHVVNSLNAEAKLPCKLVLKPLGTTPDEITHICRDANYDDKCAGLVVWLHTFSPAKCGSTA